MGNDIKTLNPDSSCSQVNDLTTSSSPPMASEWAEPSPQTLIIPSDALESFDFDLPIAQRKGKGSCTQYPISNFVSYSHLSSSYRSSCRNYLLSAPKSAHEA